MHIVSSPTLPAVACRNNPINSRFTGSLSPSDDPQKTRKPLKQVLTNWLNRNVVDPMLRFICEVLPHREPNTLFPDPNLDGPRQTPR